MSNSITGIPTSRVTESFTREQILRQTQANQMALSNLEDQLSTGYRYQVPSDDPIAAMQVVSLQRLLQQKAQVKTNLNSTQSYLGATDTSLSDVFSLLVSSRSTALSMANSATVTETQRQSAAQQINQAIQQAMNIGNQQFNGRYLFAGSETLDAPFEENSSGMIEYHGNDQHLMSYSDINLLTSTNVTGNEAFGAISAEVKGTTTIIPSLTYNTRLSDLRQGQGITRGSITISTGLNLPDGSPNQVTIDLSGAKTIGDVAALIENNAPEGTQLYVDMTNTNLTIRLVGPVGANLIIHEVGSGTVAQELGIRNDTGTTVVGAPLNPILRTTTSLDDLFGTYATAVVHSRGADNDVRLRADAMGTAYNNINIVFQGDNSVTAGSEFVDPITPGPNPQLVVHVAGNGMSRAYQVVDAINSAHVAGTIPFSADIDPLDDVNGGLGLVDLGASANTGTSGSGEPFDKTHGLQIVNNGSEHTIDFSTAETVGDALNIMNGSGAGVLAQINADRNGINVLSSVSGCDFEIGENGGTTAAQLGVRSMIDQTPLSALNFGRGVSVAQNSVDVMAQAAFSSTTANANFTITAKSTSGDPQSNHWNNFEVSLKDTGDNPPTVVYDKTTRILTVGIKAGTTTAKNVIDAVNGSAAGSDFVAADGYNSNGQKSDGTGLVAAAMLPTTGGIPAGNDFTITRSDGTILYLDLSKAKTITDVLDAINNNPNNVVLPPTPAIPNPDKLYAQLSQYGNGIELVDRSGGSGQLVVTQSRFSLAAVDLGLIPSGQTTSVPASFDHSATLVSLGDPQSGVLIHGRNPTSPINGAIIVFDSTKTGVVYNENTRTLTVGFTPGDTANDIVTSINESDAATLFAAELAPIPNDGTGAIADYGPVAMSGGSAISKAEAVAQIPGFNNDITFTSKAVGSDFNLVQVQFVGVPGGPDGVPDAVRFARAGDLITIRYDATLGADANHIVAAWGIAANWPLGDTTHNEVNCALDPADGTPNLGNAVVADGNTTVAPMTTGVTTLTGADVNPQETQGIFTALLRIRDAIANNDMLGLQRAVVVLDDATTNLNYTRAGLGAREQGLQMTQDHLASENIDLQSTLSDNHDVDFVQVVSDLTARQTAYQASLMSLGKIMQMSLLNYI